MENERDLLTDAARHQAVANPERQMESIQGSDKVQGLQRRASIPAGSAARSERVPPSLICDLVRASDAAKLERETEGTDVDDAASAQAGLRQAHSRGFRRAEAERSAHPYYNERGEILGYFRVDTDSHTRISSVVALWIKGFLMGLALLLPAIIIWDILSMGGK